MKIVAFVTEPASIRRILAHQNNNPSALTDRNGYLYQVPPFSASPNDISIEADVGRTEVTRLLKTLIETH